MSAVNHATAGNMSHHLYRMDELRSASSHAVREGRIFDKGFVDVEVDLSGHGEDVWRWNVHSMVKDVGIANPMLPLFLLLLRHRWVTSIEEYAKKNPHLKQIKRVSHVVPDARVPLIAPGVLLSRSPKSRLVTSCVAPSLMMISSSSSSASAEMDATHMNAILELSAQLEQGSSPSALLTPHDVQASLWFSDLEKQPVQPSAILNRTDSQHVRALDPVRIGHLWTYLLRHTSQLWSVVKKARLVADESDKSAKASPNGEVSAGNGSLSEERVAVDVAINEAEKSESLLLTVTHMVLSLDLIEHRTLPAEAARPTFAIVPLHQDTSLRQWQKYFTDILENKDVSSKMKRLPFWRRPIPWMWATLLKTIPAKSGPPIIVIMTLLELLAQGLANERFTPILAVLLTVRHEVLEWKPTNVDLAKLAEEADVKPILNLYVECPATEVLTADSLKQQRKLDLRTYADRYCVRGYPGSVDTRDTFWQHAKEHVGLDLKQLGWVDEDALKSHGPSVVAADNTSTPLKLYFDRVGQLKNNISGTLHAENQTALGRVLEDRNAEKNARLYLCIEDEKGAFHARIMQMNKAAYKNVWQQQMDSLFKSYACTVPAKKSGAANSAVMIPDDMEGVSAVMPGDASLSSSNGGGDDNSTLTTAKKSRSAKKTSSASSKRSKSSVSNKNDRDSDESIAAGASSSSSTKKADTASKKRKRPIVTDNDIDKTAVASATVDDVSGEPRGVEEDDAPAPKRRKKATFATDGGNQLTEELMLKQISAVLRKQFDVSSVDNEEMDVIMELKIAQLPTSSFKKFVMVTPKYVYKGPFSEDHVNDMTTLARSLFRLQVLKAPWLQDALVPETTLVYDEARRSYMLRTRNLASTPASAWKGEVHALKTHEQLKATIVNRESMGITQASKKMSDVVVTKSADNIFANLLMRYMLAMGDAHLGNFILNTQGVLMAVDFEDQRENLPLLGQIQEPTLLSCLFSKVPAFKDLSIMTQWIDQHFDALVAFLQSIRDILPDIVATSKAYECSGLVMSLEMLQARWSTLDHCFRQWSKNKKRTESVPEVSTPTIPVKTSSSPLPPTDANEVFDPSASDLKKPVESSVTATTTPHKDNDAMVVDQPADGLVPVNPVVDVQDGGNDNAMQE